VEKFRPFAADRKRATAAVATSGGSLAKHPPGCAALLKVLRQAEGCFLRRWTGVLWVAKFMGHDVIHYYFGYKPESTSKLSDSQKNPTCASHPRRRCKGRR
jgi:hypothetical protein